MIYARLSEEYADRETRLDALHSERTSTHVADRTLGRDLKHIVVRKEAVFGKRAVYLSDELCAQPQELKRPFFPASNS